MWVGEMLVCDNHPDRKVEGFDTRARTTEIARIRGWRHGEGQTIGGLHYVATLCPECSTEQRKRPKVQKMDIKQDELPWREL